MKCLRPSTLYCSLWVEAKRFRSNHNVRFVLLLTLSFLEKYLTFKVFKSYFSQKRKTAI
jgi:FtsH-binding integral membrane protein